MVVRIEGIAPLPADEHVQAVRVSVLAIAVLIASLFVFCPWY